MTDITKCVNKKCKLKEQCFRYTAKDGYWQSYAEFKKDKVITLKKECEYFIQDRKKAK